MTESNFDDAIPFAKGHGTENDFIILPDPDAALNLTPEFVRQLCDRRAGLGGDGVLRVVRSKALVDAGVLTELPPKVKPEDWFMDYRNADGSIAEMCGNGVRVFAHWVTSRGLVDSNSFIVGTRAGARPVTVHSVTESDAVVSVDMGVPSVLGVSTCTVADYHFAGLGVDVGNPHLACVIPKLTPEALRELPIAEQFTFDPAFFPEGVNIEVLTELVDGRVHMRVHERGSGETRSCGTGTVAAAQAALADAGVDKGEVVVVVPGGEVTVRIDHDGSTLTGPSSIVAEGVLVNHA